MRYGMFDFLEGHTCQRESRVSDTNQKTEWRLSRPTLARPGPSIAVSWHEFGVKLPILSLVHSSTCKLYALYGCAWCDYFLRVGVL